jgi:hypothetical protein
MSDVDPDDELQLGDVLERARESWLEMLHTALPGRVESYDADAQTADVTPMVRRRVPTESGRRVSEAMPTVRAVPIVWPRTGDWYVHLPLAAGDTVLLVCLERDPSRWLGNGGELCDPIDVRSHHLAHAVAIPGLYPRAAALTDTPSDALVIGHRDGATLRVQSDGTVVIDATSILLGSAGASEGVPFGDALKSYLDGHTHAAGTLAAGMTAVTGVTGPPSSSSPSPSTKVLVE